jgi:hypothetical protein
MRLWLDSEKMAARRVTVLDVERALREQNIELPSGRVEKRSSTGWWCGAMGRGWCGCGTSGRRVRGWRTSERRRGSTVGRRSFWGW